MSLLLSFLLSSSLLLTMMPKSFPAYDFPSFGDDTQAFVVILPIHPTPSTVLILSKLKVIITLGLTPLTVLQGVTSI